jgi:AbrB family looped-hinge helix DNA binding protein
MTGKKFPNPVTTRLEEDAQGNLILTIPKEFLDSLGWKAGDEIEFEIKDDCLLLKKVKRNKRKK